MKKSPLARRYVTFIAAIILAVMGLPLMLFGGIAVRHWSFGQPEFSFTLALLVAGAVFAAMSARSLRQVWRFSIPA